MVFIKGYYWIFVASLIFCVDRITKLLVLQHLQFEDSIGILPFFDLFFTFNRGSAFGFLNNAGGWQEFLFIGIAIVVGILLVGWLFNLGFSRDKKDILLKIALALILGGTLGNTYDRIVYHSVIDFLHFYFRQWHFPTFNVADSAICVGSSLLMLDLVYKDKNKEQSLKI